MTYKTLVRGSGYFLLRRDHIESVNMRGKVSICQQWSWSAGEGWDQVKVLNSLHSSHPSHAAQLSSSTNIVRVSGGGGLLNTMISQCCDTWSDGHNIMKFL